MLTVLLASIAYGICLAQEPHTWVLTEEVGPETPILIQTSNQGGERLAERIRLRGPNGSWRRPRVEVHGRDVRLLPSKRHWKLGRYVVEERADFDVDGHRVGQGDVASSAWFPIADVEATGSRRALAPTATRWHRLELDRDLSEIYAVTQQGPEVDWVELELRGVGVISRSTRSRDGAFRLWSGADVSCNDTHAVQPIPATGDLEARVRYHGAEGAEGAGPWRVLGSPTRGSIHPLKPPLPGAPSGRSADLRGLQSWRQASGSSDTEASHVRVRGTKHLVLVEQNEDGVALVTLTKTQQRARREFPHSRLSDLVIEADQLVAVVKHPDGHRVQHRLSLDLRAMAPEEPLWTEGGDQTVHTALRSISWRGGEMKFSPSGVLWFEESPGRVTAPLRAYGQYGGLIGEELVLVFVDGTQVTQKAVECTGVQVGVPNRWSAP